MVSLCMLCMVGCTETPTITEEVPDFTDFGLPIAEIKDDYPMEDFDDGEEFYLDAGPIFYLKPNAAEGDYYLVSENPEVVEVSDTDKTMVIIRSAGSTEISAYTTDGSNTRIAACVINVQVELISLSMQKSSVVLLSSGSSQLAVEPDPVNASDYEIEWKSSEPEVAAVSETGLVTAGEVGGEDGLFVIVPGLQYGMFFQK